MKVTTFFRAASLLSPFFASSAQAQQAAYTHAKTGITFYKQTVTSEQTYGGLEWGMALPGTQGELADEYIGYLVSRTATRIFRMLTSTRKVPCGLTSKAIRASAMDNP